MAIHPVFVQTFAYMIVLIIALMFTAVFQRGFWTKYVKVRMSFGRLVMVKIRSSLRDSFAIGWVTEGFLVYKQKVDGEKATIRLAIPKGAKAFYRCMAVVWCDVDDETHAITCADYSTVPGFDAQKHSDLHTRALMRPVIGRNYEKIVIGLLIVTALVGLGALFLSFAGYSQITALTDAMPGLLQRTGTVVSGGQI